MNLRKYFVLKNYTNFFKYKFNKKTKISYSQCGEDLLINYILRNLKIIQPHYIEIGTNDPKYINNTYLFYKQGSNGLCIEPDPEIFKKIRKVRNRDECLNVGISSQKNDFSKYYVMSSKVLSTFSKDEAEKYVADQNYGLQKIEKILDIPMIPINELMEKYFQKYGDILSIDTEGFDSEIIHALDLNKYRPKIICIETARCEKDNKVVKDNEIIEYLKYNEYLHYADTYINSIFVDKLIWPH